MKNKTSTSKTTVGFRFFSWNTLSIFKFSALLLLQFFFITTLHAQGPELIVNGNFESGNTGFTSTYSTCNSYNCLSVAPSYAIGTDASFYQTSFVGHDHTTGAGNFMILEVDGTLSSMWSESVAVQPNTNYTFSLWILNTYSNTNVITPIQVKINNVNVGSPINSPAPYVYYTWIQGSVTWNSGSATTANISLHDISGVNYANNVGLDDISFKSECTLAATVTPTGTVSTCSGVYITLTANSGSGISYQWKKGNTTLAGATNSTYSTKNAGNYKVYESNSSGCSSTSAATTVTVLAAPTATITPLGNLDICGTGSVVLQANSGSGLTYQWKKGSGDIPGETNQTYTATTKGTYKVVVTNSNGCSKTSAGVKVTKSCRIEESTGNEISSVEFLLYPNPTGGHFTLNLKGYGEGIEENEEANEPATIEVIDLLGQIIYSKNISVMHDELKKEISLDNPLPDGMYLVRVTLNDQVYSRQLLYQK
ncbi:MAG TPA: T9SS type A sorting domain-containing protein [Chitinophagales bacterium]|nr:T9SS type A sorting domain-containing protein [Chitinophagales bacterium]